MTNEDVIRREDVINLVHDLAQPCDDNLDWDISADEMIDGIKSLPSVTPQPKIGRWIRRDQWSEGVGMGENYGYYYQCSECEEIIQGGYTKCDSKYCPNCGAKMGR